MHRSIIFEDEDFRKASFSGIGKPWRKCVLVARKGGFVAMRDSKDQAKTTLTFGPAEWEAFIRNVKAGEFDV